MSISKTSKKILSAFLALLMFAAVIPFEALLGNPQLPVTVNADKLYVSMNAISTTGAKYPLSLQWNRPAPAAAPSGLPEDYHRATYYDVYYRNATLSQGYPAAPNILNIEDPEKDTLKDSGLTQAIGINEDGSMFVFRVMPKHYHVTQNTNAPPTITTVTPEPTSDLAEAVFMTDINVSASGAGQDLTVNWSNVTFDGRDVFAGYIIYYAEGVHTNPKSASGSRATKPIYIDNPLLTKINTNREFSYTINDPGLLPGKTYSVMVEPLLATSDTTWRELHDFPPAPKPQDTTRPATIKVGDKEYRLSFSSNRYVDTQASVKPDLYVEKESADTVRAWWTLPTSTKILKTEIINNPVRDTYVDADGNERLALGTTAVALGDLYADTLSEISLTDPKVVMYYQRLIWTDANPDKPLCSEVVRYNPQSEKYTPTKPNIWDVRESTVTPGVSLDIFWEPFQRRPFNAEEAELAAQSPNGKITDENIAYDIWITDDISLFNDPSMYAMKIFDGLSLASNTIKLDTLKDKDGKEVIGSDNRPFQTHEINATRYVTLKNGVLTLETMTDNKIYYVKMVARRLDAAQGEGISKPSYASCVVLPRANIPTKPIMLAKPPLRIKADPLTGAEVITTDSITIEWDLVWDEVYDAATDTWSTVTAQNPAEGKPTRQMDLTGASYKIHVVDYDYMESEGGYDAYMKKINTPAMLTDDSVWTTIPAPGSTTPPKHTVEYTVTDAHKKDAGPLKANTTYAILLIPYIEMSNIQPPDNILWAFYPNVVVATTLNERPGLEIKPTVPIILPVQSYSTSLKVKFEYKESLSYELAYSDNTTDYPANGVTVSDSDLRARGVLSTGNDGKQYMEFTIGNLFPETHYYIWVRAYANNPSGVESSEWSNAVMMTTTELAAPTPPQGLGLASQANLDIINKENSTNYLSIDYNYMVLEWLRDIRDTAPPAETGGEGDGALFLSSPFITVSYMTLFENLIGNRAYYVRAKTILTVSKTELTTGDINSVYAYTVQISLNEDFLDPIEITVPATTESTARYSITKESAWTETLKFFTSPHKGEYDGDKNPDLYPLPHNDYEIVYNAATDTLTYRFRTNKTDSSGNKDNNVDQRFISMLVQNRTFNYGIDLSAYNNKETVNKSLEIPYSIISAFDERKISLTVKAGDTTYTFQPGFLRTASVMAVTDFGANGTVQFSFQKDPLTAPIISATESFASSKQKLSVAVVSPAKTVSLGFAANPVKISQKLTSRTLAVSKNVGSYIGADKQWTRLADTYDSAAGELSFSTATIATYAAIAKNTPAATTGDNNAMYTVNSKIGFKDVAVYNPSANITANELNKIILAVANGSAEVYTKTAPTDSERNALSKAGMLVAGTQSVTREEAIAALVKLYEVKTKTQIKDYTPLSATPYTDIGNANASYRIPLLKAAQLGFFADAPAASPKSSLSYGDAIYMVSLIILDAGL